MFCIEKIDDFIFYAVDTDVPVILVRAGSLEKVHSTLATAKKLLEGEIPCMDGHIKVIHRGTNIAAVVPWRAEQELKVCLQTRYMYDTYLMSIVGPWDSVWFQDDRASIVYNVRSHLINNGEALPDSVVR